MRSKSLRLQEDEVEIAKRKMKEEEQEVDIDGRENILPDRSYYAPADDEDIVWADDEPDQDKSNWKLKVNMEDESDI